MGMSWLGYRKALLFIMHSSNPTKTTYNHSSRNIPAREEREMWNSIAALKSYIGRESAYSIRRSTSDPTPTSLKLPALLILKTLIRSSQIENELCLWTLTRCPSLLSWQSHLRLKCRQ